MAEEVIMEGDYVEEYIEEEEYKVNLQQLHEDDMAESLVALSRSGEFSHKSGREYVVENMDVRQIFPSFCPVLCMSFSLMPFSIHSWTICCT
ncbi:hypothetical protein KIN20_033486 [Parelaphostrongylus tenuis]|uniref:Uncharacterized protein n=1 Tax=Parelaphostrongylus tenuis TaxID=148309 RepID=A0AAD5R8N8_PARTN|nr:hypothetical protein KIN20_033486 [Parelaphostrongylus tenuis]